MDATKNKAVDTKKRNRIIAGVAGFAGLLGLGFFFARGMRRKPTTTYIPPSTEQPSSTSISVPSTPNIGFPLKFGSKGQLVRDLQQAVEDAYPNETLLPKYHVDGDWGTETQYALQSKSLPTYYTSSTYYETLKKLANLKTSSQSSSLNIPSVATNLWRACIYRKWEDAKAGLAKLKSTTDYSNVSNIFKTKFIGGVRKTLVNGMLDAFTQSYQRTHIHNEFIRMGLKWNGSQWSLSGLGNTPLTKIKTLYSTNVWNESNNRSIEVPGDTIIGTFVQNRNGVTTYRTNTNKVFKVATKAVSHI